MARAGPRRQEAFWRWRGRARTLFLRSPPGALPAPAFPVYRTRSRTHSTSSRGRPWRLRADSLWRREALPASRLFRALRPEPRVRVRSVLRVSVRVRGHSRGRAPFPPRGLCPGTPPGLSPTGGGLTTRERTRISARVRVRVGVGSCPLSWAGACMQSLAQCGPAVGQRPLQDAPASAALLGVEAQAPRCSLFLACFREVFLRPSILLRNLLKLSQVRGRGPATGLQPLRPRGRGLGTVAGARRPLTKLLTRQASVSHFFRTCHEWSMPRRGP